MSKPLLRVTTRIAYGASQLPRTLGMLGTAWLYAGYPTQHSDAIISKHRKTAPVSNLASLPI